MKEKIEKRLDEAINNLSTEDFESAMPLILDDLEYVILNFNDDKRKMSPVEQFEYGTGLTKKN